MAVLANNHVLCNPSICSAGKDLSCPSMAFTESQLQGFLVFFILTFWQVSFPIPNVLIVAFDEVCAYMPLAQLLHRRCLCSNPVFSVDHVNQYCNFIFFVVLLWCFSEAGYLLQYGCCEGTVTIIAVYLYLMFPLLDLTHRSETQNSGKAGIHVG